MYASADLQAGSASARQALVIIHGRLRNAADYFATGLALAKAAGPLGEATIVVAPQFLDPADVTAHHLADRYLRWNTDWAEGRPALSPAAANPDDPAASSYDVLDDVVAKLSNKVVVSATARESCLSVMAAVTQMLARYAVVMRPQPGPAISFCDRQCRNISVSHDSASAAAATVKISTNGNTASTIRRPMIGDVGKIRA